MVLSCFRPVASAIPASFGRFVLPRARESRRSSSPSSSAPRVRLRFFSEAAAPCPSFLLPSFFPPFFLPSFAAIFPPHPGTGTYLLLTSLPTSAAAADYLRGSLNARFKREIKFILFIHSRGCQFNLSLSVSLPSSSPLPRFSRRSGRWNENSRRKILSERRRTEAEKDSRRGAPLVYFVVFGKNCTSSLIIGAPETF